MPSTQRPPSPWPLALALAAALFFMRTEPQLYLLAISLAALFVMAATTFAAASRLDETRQGRAAHDATSGSARTDLGDTTARRESDHAPDGADAAPIAGCNGAIAHAGTPRVDAPAVALFVPSTTGTLLAAGALLVLFASVPFSTLPMTSLWFAWILGLFPLGYLLGVTALARGAPSGGVMRATGLFIGASALWGVIEWLQTGNRSNGPFLDFNAFGALFYLAIPPAMVALAVSSTRRARLILGSFLALCLWALFATASRGAIGILGLMLVPLVLGLRRAGTAWRAPVAMLLVLGALAYGVVRYAPEAPVTRELVRLGTDQSTQDRLAMWRSASQMWADRPWMGQGLGSYKLHYLHYRSPEEITSTGDLAHNDYVQLLAEGGPLLPALLILAGLATLLLARRLWRRMGPAAAEDERREALTGWSMVLPVLGLFVHAGVNFIFYVAPLALMAGLMLARARHAAGSVPLRQVRLAARPRLVGAAYGLGAGLALGALSVDWLASQAFDPGNRWPVFAERRANPVARYQMAMAFAALRPHHVATQQALTTSAIDLAFADRTGPIGSVWAGLALTHARTWLAASRGNPYVDMSVGQLAWHFPVLQPHLAPEFPADPAAILRRAIEGDWINAEHYLLLARYQEEVQHAPERALETLVAALRWARVPQPSAAGVEAWKRLYRRSMALSETTGQGQAAIGFARIVIQFDPSDESARRLLAAAPAAGDVAAR
jgi:O-antigen ligase